MKPGNQVSIPSNRGSVSDVRRGQRVVINYMDRSQSPLIGAVFLT
ncbi:hypothetical protein MTBBW1_1360003 [Desulfamplus magnetovallimortis]|uniref:Uncharacterized protein n=1 Tax=Desulfamplus magnetovallimortis TaxID=1246637 RepID=A0A1W1H7N3_9BACT|nr:hypothetical protein MTBBW1_1360003 [Desulfamplus magnetovallimortis]